MWRFTHNVRTFTRLVEHPSGQAKLIHMMQPSFTGNRCGEMHPAVRNTRRRESHMLFTSLSERPEFRSTRRKDRVHLLQVDAETKDAVGHISDSSRLSVARLIEKHHGSGALLCLMCLQAWKLRVSSCLRSPIGRRSIGRASFRRSPVSGQKCFTVLSSRINNNYAEKKGTAKKFILTIRAIMISQEVDLVAGDFNGTAWRCRSKDNLSTLDEAFTDCALPTPPGPTPLWGPGSIPDNWTDVCGFLKPLGSQLF